MNTKLELWSSVRFRKAWVQELVDFQKHIWFRWTFRCVTLGLRRKSAVDWLTSTFTRMRHWLIGCCLDLSLMKLLTFKCMGLSFICSLSKVRLLVNGWFESMWTDLKLLLLNDGYLSWLRTLAKTVFFFLSYEKRKNKYF